MTMQFCHKIQKIIEDGASEADPKKLANAVYFLIKQHPEKPTFDSDWVGIMKVVKKRLSERHGWDMREIYKFFTKLHYLTQYMEKSS